MLFPFSGEQKCYLLFCFQTSFDPNFIYSWSISHIFNMNSSVSAVWAAQGSKEKKVFNWAKKKNEFYFFWKYCRVHIKGGFFSESEIRFSNLPNYSKELSWAWNLNKLFKVWTFWEAHKIWKNLPHGLDVY